MPSMAADSGAGRRMNAGISRCTASVAGCAKLARTRSVSMKPK